MARPGIARWSTAFLAAVLVAGACGADAQPTASLATAVPPPTLEPTPPPTPTPSPRPTPTRATSPTPAPDPTAIPLAAGNYDSVMLEPGISYALPSGWEQYADTRTWFETSPPGHRGTIAIFVRPKAAKPTTGCVALADAAVGPKASDLVAWISAHPALAVSKPSAASVAGLPGKVIDVALDPTWTDECPWDYERPGTSLLLFGDTGTDVWGVTGDQHLRLYIADLPGGGTFVIDIDHFYGWDLEEFRAAAQPIVESIAIRDLPKPLPSAIPSGTTGKVTLADYSLTLTLPKGWRTLGMSADDVDDVIDAIPEDILPAGVEDRMAGLIAAGLKLWAFDHQKANLGANVSIMALPKRIPEPLLLLTAKSLAGQLPSARNVKVTEVKVDGQPAVRIDLQLTLSAYGRTLTLTETQLYLPRPTTTLVVTIAIPKGGQLKDRDSLVKSIRLG
jgi:hypothetical protein